MSSIYNRPKKIQLICLTNHKSRAHLLANRKPLNLCMKLYTTVVIKLMFVPPILIHLNALTLNFIFCSGTGLQLIGSVLACN